MIRKEVVVRIDSGIETRPVALLVQTASQYSSDIYLELENRHVNAKSIMGMMTLGLDTGAEVTIIANGPDEQEAMDTIEAYLTRKTVNT